MCLCKTDEPIEHLFHHLNDYRTRSTKTKQSSSFHINLYVPKTKTKISNRCIKYRKFSFHKFSSKQNKKNEIQFAKKEFMLIAPLKLC